MSTKNRKTNQALISLVEDLKDHSRNTGSALWRDIANRLESSKNNWAQPNLSKLSRHSQGKEVIIVPGKVLGSGNLIGNQTVAAFSFSEGAKEKIEDSGGRVLSIRDLMNENPSGKGVKILV
tara:strand:+ start:306 stop:671 length:366 start_codon:yes stop_codon:yes gene_type:complete